MQDQDLYNGLIRLHILHHAAQHEIFGLGIIRELGRHGYEVGPGTIYPLLHRMEERGYLTSKTNGQGRSPRRSYRATAQGKRALVKAKKQVRELFSELFEDEG